MGLYAYTRQASLSLHRASTLQELASFYQEHVRYSVAQVVDALQLPAFTPDEPSLVSFSALIRCRHSFCELVTLRLFRVPFAWHFRGGAIFPRAELYYVTDALRRFDCLLSGKEAWNRDVVVDVRLNLGRSSYLLGQRLPAKVATRCEQVIHLNHAQHLVLISTEEIAGKEWLSRL